MKTIKMLVVLGMTAGSVAGAGSVGGTFSATARVDATCQITSQPTELAFGNYDVYATAATVGSTKFSVKCAKGTTYTMKLSGGNASGVRAFSTVPTGAALNYVLSFGSTPWGDGASGHAAPQVVTAASATAVEYTVNGSIAPNQESAATGLYSDTVTLSVDY